MLFVKSLSLCTKKKFLVLSEANCFLTTTFALRQTSWYIFHRDFDREKILKVETFRKSFHNPQQYKGRTQKKGRPSVKIKSAPAPFREKRFHELFSKASSVRSKIASSPSLSQRKSKKSSLISLSTMLRSIFTSSSWFVHQLTTISKSFSLSVKWAYLTKKENHELLIPQHPFVDWHHVTGTTNLPEGIKFPFGLCLLSCISGGEEGRTRKWRRTRRITREDIHPTLNTITGSFLLALPLAM
jgi:hypothetical protein